MERTTVMLPAELKQRATQRCREIGVSFGEFVRVSLRDELARAASNRTDPVFVDDDVFSGDAPTDAAASHDALLYGSDR